LLIQFVCRRPYTHPAGRARDRVLRANAKLRAHDYSKGLPPEHRDQGFTRPRVLILLPTRHAALQVVQQLIDLLPSTYRSQVENKKRFKTEYSLSPEEAEEERRSHTGNPKPADWQHLFAGNVDDCFRVGLRCTPKSVKIYADFYTSDILVASPLGLRMLIGAEGDRQRDFDYLSSIEVMLADQLSMLAMQNWDHVTVRRSRIHAPGWECAQSAGPLTNASIPLCRHDEQHLFEHLNLMPKDPHDCDFSRVRSWCLDGQYASRNKVGKGATSTCAHSQHVLECGGWNPRTS